MRTKKEGQEGIDGAGDEGCAQAMVFTPPLILTMLQFFLHRKETPYLASSRWQ